MSTAKNYHEIRDPIHIFVHLDSHELKVLNSRPFQRLRYIHQLALTYLVYPGASHKRFEHSLGVMELAGRVFDVLTQDDAIDGEVRKLIPEISQPSFKQYWRRVLRMAALCHDLGHLPFSHGAEKDLLPDGWNHEQITKEIILSNEMEEIWGNMTPPLRAEDVVKLAVGPKENKDLKFSDWEAILSEIIVGDAFGVDRIDYLLRDSHHTGVGYGKFDHYRLIDTLRILHSSPEEGNHESSEPVLGIQEGGIHSAEALLLARYFMYSQVYFHPVRRIYDIHLKDFLGSWLPGGKFSTKIEKHLRMTDNDVIAAMLDAARNDKKSGHEHAKRIVRREHFRILYQRSPEDVKINPEAGHAVYEAAKNRFGESDVRYDKYIQRGSAHNFPVLIRSEKVVSSIALSETLNKLPLVAVEYVFISPDKREDAEKWLKSNLNEIIQPKMEEAGS